MRVDRARHDEYRRQDMKRIATVLAGLSLLVAAVLLGGRWWLLGSLPRLDGVLQLAGIDTQTVIERDAQGLVTITGASRTDIAFALGFVHAQERFFQMDLQRRSAAGELAELFGAPAVDHDRSVRAHRFRARAGAALAGLDRDERALIDAYVAGVNQGIADLARPPFEYTLLRSAPRRWTAVDSMLTIYSMYLVLQDPDARHERGRGLMADVLPPDLYAFFTQQGGEWDAPLYGEPLPSAPLPRSTFAALLTRSDGQPPVDIVYRPFAGDDELPGSNNWAVAGALTAHGSALVANDMHLPMRVPNIWFRAAWTHPETGRTVSGATLPGMPALVAGSNGRVAWGFTNTQGDWSDVVILSTDEAETRYRSPHGYEPFVEHPETVRVRGADDVELTVRETRWGPVIGRDHQGRLLALRWTAHDPRAVNARLAALETVDSVAEALPLAPRFGVPHQNLVLGDADGAIAWTVAGPVPRRVGFDGVLPTRWDDGTRRWDGYYPAARHPRVVNPESGRLWTANSRIVSGTAFERMGSQGAALGARQRQIRDRLLARKLFDEAAMLAIQRDAEAVFLARWQERLLRLLDGTATADPALREARDLVRDWAGAAESGDVGYRLVREYRSAVIERVVAPLESMLTTRDPDFSLRHVSRQIEYPVWALIEARPGHLLNPDFESWQALELDAVRAVIAPLYTDGSLANDTWGEANRLRIEHPLVAAFAPLRRWLAMPDEPMGGDSHLPYVQRPSFAASERFAVAPGREHDAYFHMATGQSAHPLSPYFNAGHDDWLHGRASPWLPGATRYRLTLVPATP
jgi:penicillin amidase